MFDTLVESRPAARRASHRYAAVSVLAHAGLIAGAAAATGQAVKRPTAPDEPITVVTFVRNLASRPVARTPGRAPSPTDGGYAGSPLPVPSGPVIDIPVGIPPIDVPLLDPSAASGFQVGEPRPGSPILAGPYAGGPAGPSATYTREQVERIAVLRAGASPRYPAGLRSAGVEGEVVVRLVVDTIGRVQPGSAVVVRSSHDAFTAAVLEVLPRLRFAPAAIGGRRVRQLVELPFTFRIDP